MQHTSQTEKARLFHSLHYNGNMLLLPNVRYVLSAKIIESLGFPAIATASAAISNSNGYSDGENLPFGDFVSILKKIVNAVKVPVTADIESGYTSDLNTLENNIRQLTSIGIVGINIEGSNAKTKETYSIEEQCDRIKTIRKVADEMGVPLFINARTDAFLYSNENATEEEKLNEIIKRGKAYQLAGADGLYPILATSIESINSIVQETNMPVNILGFENAPALQELRGIKVARVSLGSGLLNSAIVAIVKTATNCKKMKDYADFLSNEKIELDIENLLKNKE